MQKLSKITAIRPSANFGATVNGRVNRVLAVSWSANNTDVVFVGQGQEFAGNLVLPDSYSVDQIEAFRQKVQTMVDGGELSVYGYEFPVAVVSDGTAKAYTNPAKPTNAPMETIRRAWPNENAYDELLTLVKSQVKKSLEKGKLVAVPV